MSITTNIDVEASELVPTILPRWWPCIAGVVLVVGIFWAAVSVPYSATWSGTVKSHAGESCVIQPTETNQVPLRVIQILGADTVRSGNQVTVSPCPGPRLQVNTPIEVNEQSTLWKTVHSFLVNGGGSL